MKNSNFFIPRGMVEVKAGKLQFWVRYARLLNRSNEWEQHPMHIFRRETASAKRARLRQTLFVAYQFGKAMGCIPFFYYEGEEPPVRYRHRAQARAFNRGFNAQRRELGEAAKAA